MDIRSRTKVAFVVEHYGADEVGEAGRRTRAMAAAMAARGHDVTVLSTCARRPGLWANDVADGKASLDGVALVRFRITRPQQKWLSRTAFAVTGYHSAAGHLWARAHGPVCAGYRRYLDHLGYLFDAVFFTGEWGYLPTEGIGRVRNAVLCPPPSDDPTRKVGHAAALLRAARAVAVATPDERDLLAAETGLTWSCPTFITGACAEPWPTETQRTKRMRLVDGPFLLHVGHRNGATDALVESFRFFREAHGATPMEDDEGRPFVGRDVRLVLAGDFAFQHAPEEGVLALGPIDDVARMVLLRGALALVHPDPAIRLPTSLLEAWSQGRATLVHGRSASMSAVIERAGPEYGYESPSTFAASAASLLSRRGPRHVFGARAAEVTRRMHAPAKVVDALEKCVRAVLRRSGGASTLHDASSP